MNPEVRSVRVIGAAAKDVAHAAMRTSARIAGAKPASTTLRHNGLSVDKIAMNTANGSCVVGRANPSNRRAGKIMVDTNE